MTPARTTKPAEGTRYRALTGLAYATNAAAIERIQKGEEVSLEERDIVEASAGDVVTDIPAVSIPWLLEQGLIEEAVDG